MPDRVELLGGAVDLVNRDQVMDFISDTVALGRKAIVGNQNLHSLYLSQKSATMAAFFAASDLIEIDSMPLIFWGRALGLELSRQNRCTYLDWRDRFWRLAADQGWRVFCLGAAEPANRAALVRLRRQWPGVQLRGHHGYFDHRAHSLANADVVEEINRFRPDIILVGMGMPLQEAWIIENYAALVSGVVLSVGAAFDYEAGVQPAAPRIYGDLGIEWLYRFAHEPRRLFRRYMIEPWSLLGLAAGDVSRRLTERPVTRPLPRPVFRDYLLEDAAMGPPSVSDDLQNAA
ncbi:MAG TPA: WecB/TagA/CpsF family glycosyltransferase [Caulobacteraceae bacterium]|nr:WecB/TagA/CpsF family glycosyltransferase [Caulobacteraceae bacterium]